MTKRMLIDATHPEETRVVVLDGNRLEDFDVETSTKKQVKGNIYLAKVIRVEPSLQAAFVEYGGNRHGFLAFSEIHPDYYQIPVADRQKLLEAEAAAARAEAEAEDAEEAAEEAAAAASHSAITAESDAIEQAIADAAATDAEPAPRAQAAAVVREIVIGELAPPDADAASEDQIVEDQTALEGEIIAPAEISAEDGVSDDGAPEPERPETLGGGANDQTEENGERRSPPRFVRNYKIQEVIHRRQILLIQVVKEERGTKGAALTTYLSLAGRYCVLMPNSPRGGGVSRKITSVADRKRLREVIKEVDMPQGMGLIVRTAGANRPKPEIRRDCEYLLRLWDDIRDLTMKSVAPALVYEEANLIKRTIRDGYTRDIEEVLVDGEAGWKAARDFMRMLTPQHAAKVQLWRGHDTSLFAKHQVDMQLDAMMSPTVQLKSGGYLVINQAEALVAIDVNSGRSTRERNIEETALRTNLEAADEAARQLRLRDLAGLVVIDFIDMESRKHNGMVEARLKNALKNDRARIQVGSISHFGLLEMSRQRLRPSLAETAFITCPHCMGTGTVRSVESAAIHVLRAIEDEAARRRSAEILVHVAGAVAMYILNQKRDRLMAIERAHGLQIMLAADDKLMPPQVRIEKVRAYVASEAPAAQSSSPIAMDYAARDESSADEDRGTVRNAALVADAPVAAEATSEAAAPVAVTSEEARGDDSGERRRRRRRRRRGRRENGENGLQAENGQGDAEGDDGDDAEGEEGAVIASPEPGPAPQEPAVPPIPVPFPDLDPAEPGHGPELPVPGETVPEIVPPAEPAPEMPAPNAGEDGEARRSRRGRRGGRGRRPGAADETPAVPPVAGYRGPTPADPFTYDQIDALFAGVEPDLEPARPAARKAAEVMESLDVTVVDAPVTGGDVSAVDLVESLLSSPAVETVASAETAVPVLETVAVELTLTEEPVAEKPAKKPRASRARKPKVTEAVAETVEAPVTVEAAPVDVVAEPEAAPAKPVRRRASRAKAAVVEAVAEPVAEAVVAEPAIAEPAAAELAPAEVASPVIKPVVIGADTPVAEKRRGWWKR